MRTNHPLRRCLNGVKIRKERTLIHTGVVFAIAETVELGWPVLDDGEALIVNGRMIAWIWRAIRLNVERNVPEADRRFARDRL